MFPYGKLEIVDFYFRPIAVDGGSGRGVAGFDDKVRSYFVEGADGQGEGVGVVAEGVEEIPDCLHLGHG